MANAILFIGWNRPHIGMEDQAFGYLSTEGHAYLKSLEGKSFERMEVFALTAHSGDMNGGVILFGEREKLDALRRTDAFEAFSMKMGSMFDRYGVVPGVNWEGIQAVMSRRQRAKH